MGDAAAPGPGRATATVAAAGAATAAGGAAPPPTTGPSPGADPGTINFKDILHGKIINAQTLIHVGPDRRRGGGARALARGRTKTVGGYTGCCMHSVADVKGGKLARTKAKAKTLIQYQAHTIGVG